MKRDETKTYEYEIPWCVCVRDEMNSKIRYFRPNSVGFVWVCMCLWVVWLVILVDVYFFSLFILHNQINMRNNIKKLNIYRTENHGFRIGLFCDGAFVTISQMRE